MNRNHYLKMLGYGSLLSIIVVTLLVALERPLLAAAEMLHNHHRGGTPETGEMGAVGEASQHPQAGVGGGATLRVEDPVTGELTPLPPAIEKPVSTSDEGLVETEDAGGGRMVRLGGRFRTYMKVVQDEAGQISASCSSERHH